MAKCAIPSCNKSRYRTVTVEVSSNQNGAKVGDMPLELCKEHYRAQFGRKGEKSRMVDTAQEKVDL